MGEITTDQWAAEVGILHILLKTALMENQRLAAENQQLVERFASGTPATKEPPP